MNNRPLVAVSACLLGHAVRYDGQHKYAHLLVKELEHHCQLIALCPEVEIGLGIPRAKIQLTQVGSTIKVLKTDEMNVDVATNLATYARKFVNQYSLSGMVLQDKSPSCGIGNVNLFSESGKKIGLGTGAFASAIIKLLPSLQVVQASQLHNKIDIQTFLKKIS